MNNLSVTKSNNLVDASYKLNVQAQKLILACLGKIDSRAEIPNEITITAIEYGDLMGISNARRDLYKAADHLFDAVITLKDNNEEIKLRWVQKSVLKKKGEGSVTITWSDDVLKYISVLKNRFTTYKLRHISELKSGHSIRLYELLMRFNSTGARIISIADFKSALGVSDKYPKFKELTRRVINPAIDELNKSSDLIVQYETLKKGKTVTALAFSFTQKH